MHGLCGVHPGRNTYYSGVILIVTIAVGGPGVGIHNLGVSWPLLKGPIAPVAGASIVNNIRLNLFHLLIAEAPPLQNPPTEVFRYDIADFDKASSDLPGFRLVHIQGNALLAP